jgi:pyroglutamyl-peptidase
VVHFGLAQRAGCIRLERVARKRVDPDKPDAAGFAPKSGLARRSGPQTLTTTFPIEAIRRALLQAGFPAELSDDAGSYVCNATLYRSLGSVSPEAKRVVGFVHVPPEGAGGFTRDWLGEAARLVLATAASLWAEDAGKLR